MSLGEYLRTLHILPVLLFAQVILILFFGLFTQYDPDFDPVVPTGELSMNYYAPFQDVHVMMFIGFGFLYVYLGKYGYNSVSFNFLLGALVIQWSILNLGFWENVAEGLKDPDHHWERIHLRIQLMIDADYAVAAVLISLGGVLGKFSAAEYILMAFIEIIFYSINYFIGTKLYGAIDVGGSMWIHTFGAYYGLALAWCFSNQGSFKKENNHSLYNSNIFSILGTIFLWMFWPSFNCALAVGGAQHRVVINTVLSLAASCVTTFCWSGMFRKGKFDIVEIQNATLAGGVAVGCTADLIIQPYGALILGFVAGTVSTFGFCKIMPFLEKTIRLHDTAGIHNLHAMPGMIGGLSGIFAALTQDQYYGEYIGTVYPFRAPSNETLAGSLGMNAGIDRDRFGQAGFQAAAVFTSMGLGILGALITAVIFKLPCICHIEKEEYFLDNTYWHELPPDYPGKRYGTGNEENESNMTEVKNDD
jgi:ammonium transporter Rh